MGFRYVRILTPNIVHLYHRSCEYSYHLTPIPDTLYIILVDLDVQIPRRKSPKTALPSDVRDKLGLKKRTIVGRQSMCKGADGISKGGTYKIEKRQFLKRGKSVGGGEAMVERKYLQPKPFTLG